MKSFFSVTLLLLGLGCFGQTVDLKVKVIAGTADSFPAATLQLFRLPDSVLINTQISAADGNKFTVRPFSKYLLKVSAIGFNSVEKPISIINKPLNVSVELKKKIKGLDEVVLVARKQLMKQEDDKTIVDAEVLANSSSNAYEVLEKTPGAIVDQDGNVYLSSMTPATIQINGREVKLSSSDLASLLKSLPAASLSKIEILRNPSAKYDAASSGGIVNIVLKKGVKTGASGSINMGSFQGIYNTKFAGFNLNRSAGKASIYLSYQWTDRNYFEDLNSSRLLSVANSSLVQAAHTIYPSVNQYIGAGTDIALTKKFYLAYDLRLSVNSNRSNALNEINIMDQNMGIAGKNASLINNRNTSLYLGNNISSKYKIDSAGSEWTLQFDYNLFNYNNRQHYNNYYYLPAKPTLFGNGDNHNRKNIFTAQTDVVLKLQQGITLETGVKTIVSNSSNAADYFIQQGNGDIKVDSFQTNTFKYTEAITSAYLQVSKKDPGFYYQAGGTNGDHQYQRAAINTSR